MPPVQDQIKEINESVSRINEGLTGTNIKPLPALTPDNIQEDVPVIEIPEVPVDQTIEGDMVDFAGDAQAGMDEFTATQAFQRDQAELAKNQSLDSFLNELQTQQSLGELQLEGEEKFGVAPLEKSLNAINNQILQEQTKLRRIKERVTEEGGGLKMGAAAEIRNAEDQSYRRQADLALQKLAIQGDYSVAVDRADRYAQAMYDRQKTQLEVRKFIYDDLKDQFSIEDQRAFNMAYDSYNRKIEQERADFVSLQNAKIEAIKMAQMNNAPQSVIDAIGNAQTPQDVFVNGGQYASADMLDRMYKQAQIASIYDTINQRAETARKAAQEAATQQEAAQKQREADSEQALGIRDLAANLLIDPGMGAAVGFGLGKSVRGAIPFATGAAFAGSNRADFEANAQRLANMLTLENLDLMSGVLSETDIKILESAGSNLGNFNMSEKQYRQELQRVLDVANRSIEKNGLTEEQALFWGIIDESDEDIINSIFD